MLEKFKNSLIEAAKLSGNTIETLSRPIYLVTCNIYDIDGWTKGQISDYEGGWAQLKKDVTGKGNVREYRVTNPVGTYAVPVEGKAEKEARPLKDLYLEEYARFVSINHYVPTMRVFRNWYGAPIKKDVYSNIDEIDNDYRKQYASEAKQNLFDRKTWDEEYKKAFNEELKKHKKFILVSVGSFCNVDFAFLKTLKLYADLQNAMVIGLPLFKKHSNAMSDFCIDPTVRKYMWITFEDVIFNDNLMAQVIKANCTTKSTLTGLNQIVAKYNSSIIVAGINQQLRYIPVLKDKTPNMIASTGCITEYELSRKDDLISIPTKAEKLAQERLSIKGGLIVELGENDTFSVRNIEADEDGSFIDLGEEYLEDTYWNPVKESVFVIGDLHAPQHNETLLQANIDVIEKFRCTQVVLHDSVNMGYISHHNADKAITRAQMVEEGKADILVEIGEFAKILKRLVDIPTVKKVIIPYSNHPAHFDRFIQDIGRMAKDDINLRTSLMTALAMLDNKNTLQFLVEEVLNFKNEKLCWVPEDKGVEVFGVQVGLHGSEKVNGGKLTSVSTNNAFAKTVIAHKHSASIDGDTVTVGIVCEKDQGYNHGLSSWTESSAIVYHNGKVQLLTFVNVKGEYKLWL